MGFNSALKGLMGCLIYIYLRVKIINVDNLLVCAPLGYYAGKSGLFLDFLTLEDGTDRLF
jgi:hypothetical protein